MFLRRDGSFQVKEWINDNANKLDLPSKYNVSVTFNLSDFSLFNVDDNSMVNPFEEKRNDKDQRASLRDPLHMLVGPITRVKVKWIKKVVSDLIQKLWTKEEARLRSNLHES